VLTQALELNAGTAVDPVLALVLGIGVLTAILALVRYFANRS
jgi:hypothetical protein